MLALKGAAQTLRTIDVIVTETSNVEYNKGAPETLEILNFMDRLGFKIFDITETHRKPLRSGEDSHAGGSGVLFQLDFLFVRKTSPLLKEVRSSLQISRSLCKPCSLLPWTTLCFAVQASLPWMTRPVCAAGRRRSMSSTGLARADSRAWLQMKAIRIRCVSLSFFCTSDT